MNKKLIYCTAAISLFLISCTKDAEFISKHYPIIQTQNVSDINSNGVTFNGEFLDIGYSNITEYGFVFDTYEPSIEKSDTLIIASKAANGVFSGSTSENLAGNVNYNVKAYAKTNYNVIYGNNIEFLSQGSKFNPWDLILKPDKSGSGNAHGMSNNELGFILYLNGDFYSFNPDNNTVTRKQKIPIDGNQYAYYASFNLDNYLYILTNDSKEVLKYDIENNQWTKLGNRPFSPDQNTGFFGFSINNIGYFLSRGNFYSYNQSIDTWSKELDIPSDYNIRSAVVIDNKVYVFTHDRWIWSFNPESNIWQKETRYPGTWNGRIANFIQENRIYWGLSYNGSDDSNPATDFWEYSPELNSWKKVENFPLVHSRYGQVTFSINSFSYFGYQHHDHSTNYLENIIFRFDSQKIK